MSVLKDILFLAQGAADENNRQEICRIAQAELANGNGLSLKALRKAEEALSVLRSQYENRGEWYEGWATNALPIVREAIAEIESTDNGEDYCGLDSWTCEHFNPEDN